MRRYIITFGVYQDQTVDAVDCFNKVGPVDNFSKRVNANTSCHLGQLYQENYIYPVENQTEMSPHF